MFNIYPVLSTFWPVFTRPFFLFALFVGDPSSSPFLGTFSPFSSPRKVLCSVEKRVQSRAWRGAAPGCTFPQSSGRKFLPEICVKKGQHFCMNKLVSNCSKKKRTQNGYALKNVFVYYKTGLKMKSLTKKRAQNLSKAKHSKTVKLRAWKPPT